MRRSAVLETRRVGFVETDPQTRPATVVDPAQHLAVTVQLGEVGAVVEPDGNLEDTASVDRM